MAYHLVANEIHEHPYMTTNQIVVDRAFSQKINRLEEVDKILCRYTSYDLEELLRDQGLITTQNHFVIAHTYREEFYYDTILFGHPELIPVIDSLVERRKIENGHPVTFRTIPRNSEFFEEKLKELEEKLGDDPKEFFENVYGDTNSELASKTLSYYEVKDKDTFNYDEAETQRETREAFLEEFSKYKTMRKYMVNMERYNRYGRRNRYKIVNPDVPNYVNIPLGETKLVYSSKNEEESDYYDEDKHDEEYLTQEEIDKYTEEGSVWEHAPKAR